MGWGSGSELMSEIIAAVKPKITDADTRRDFYVELIRAFESADCDTLSECVGDDSAFAQAYGLVNPCHGGWQAARDGKLALENPYQDGTSEAKEWALGWKEYHQYNS